MMFPSSNGDKEDSIDSLVKQYITGEISRLTFIREVENVADDYILCGIGNCPMCNNIMDDDGSTMRCLIARHSVVGQNRFIFGVDGDAVEFDQHSELIDFLSYIFLVDVLNVSSRIRPNHTIVPIIHKKCVPYLRASNLTVFPMSEEEIISLAPTVFDLETAVEYYDEEDSDEEDCDEELDSIPTVSDVVKILDDILSEETNPIKYANDMLEDNEDENDDSEEDEEL